MENDVKLIEFRKLTSCLENPRDGGAWWAAVYGVAQSQTRLSDSAAALKGELGDVGERGPPGLQAPGGQTVSLVSLFWTSDRISRCMFLLHTKF